jgi:antitoxin ParD1/3/4
MAKNTSVSLREHFDQFIAAQLYEGALRLCTEVVRVGLSLLEKQLEMLRQLIAEGRTSGTAEHSYEVPRAVTAARTYRDDADRGAWLELCSAAGAPGRLRIWPGRDNPVQRQLEGVNGENGKFFYESIACSPVRSPTPFRLRKRSFTGAGISAGLFP